MSLRGAFRVSCSCKSIGHRKERAADVSLENIPVRTEFQRVQPCRRPVHPKSEGLSAFGAESPSDFGSPASFQRFSQGQRKGCGRTAKTFSEDRCGSVGCPDQQTVPNRLARSEAFPLRFLEQGCRLAVDAQQESQLKSELLTALQPAFARISAAGVRYSSIPAHAKELAALLNEELSGSWRDIRGIAVVSFGMNSIRASEEDERIIKQLQSAAVMRDPNMAAANLVAAQSDAMRIAAGNEGGAANGFVGMGFANMMGGTDAASLFSSVPASARHEGPQGQPTWRCSCGEANSGPSAKAAVRRAARTPPGFALIAEQPIRATSARSAAERGSDDAGDSERSSEDQVRSRRLIGLVSSATAKPQNGNKLYDTAVLPRKSSGLRASPLPLAAPSKGEQADSIEWL